jgi:hypothetical protein
MVYNKLKIFYSTRPVKFSGQDTHHRLMVQTIKYQTMGASWLQQVSLVTSVHLTAGAA